MWLIKRWHWWLAISGSTAHVDAAPTLLTFSSFPLDHLGAAWSNDSTKCFYCLVFDDNRFIFAGHGCPSAARLASCTCGQFVPIPFCLLVLLLFIGPIVLISTCRSVSVQFCPKCGLVVGGGPPALIRLSAKVDANEWRAPWFRWSGSLFSPPPPSVVA